MEFDRLHDVAPEQAETAGDPDNSDPILAHLLARAATARDEARNSDATTLYAEARLLGASGFAFEMEYGRASVQAGALERAEHCFRAAALLRPTDGAAWVELGCCYRIWGRSQDAESAFEEAERLQPEWDRPLQELEALHASGWRGRRLYRQLNAQPSAPKNFLHTSDVERIRSAPESLSAFDSTDKIVPETLPASAGDRQAHYNDSLDLFALGRRERSAWGIAKTLRGVEAIRGICLSPDPIVELELRLGSETIWRGPPKGPYPLGMHGGDSRLAKYVFNIWYDFGDIANGRYTLDVRAKDLRGHMRSRNEYVVVADASSRNSNTSSDGCVDIDPADTRSLSVRINTAKSVVRSPHAGAGSLRSAGNILVQRLDQLGDLAVSVPALRRLAQLFPSARLTGLVTPANAALAHTLDIFDRIIVADFPDDPAQGRRTMAYDAQRSLAEALTVHSFDMAIDLSENSASRPLLLLSGAPFLYGFGSREFPWLTAEAQGYTHDAANGHEMVSHAAKLMALVEWLGAITGHHAARIRRADVPLPALEASALEVGSRYAVLHTGARLAFSRWPHFAELARLLIERTDLRVVMLADAPSADAELAALGTSDRVTLIEAHLPFDQLDALLHHCALFVGNDSGPKHLAALRGVPVASLHMARNNWNEWGQDKGIVISRRVPCAGCLIQQHEEDCGRDLACLTHIKPEEVFDAISGLL